ncbi:MAG: 50S ribosomal protein L21e [Candidatus Aenigmarchaeota archaeon]|nr:50S ribosomal protein L21e [Candidatus Aenigmarchaeota archaeon]MCK4531245.1 50S ribosomal protein L21e [Candidatus Aenigmarchaeota archaeon]
MVKASKGFRRSTRRKLKKKIRQKFKVTPYLKEFRSKDKVVIKIDPSSQKGMPFPKFKGMIGEVKEKRGNAYVIKITVGKKIKEVIARPEHLVLKG